LVWSDAGLSNAYTVEARSSLSAPWMATPATVWPMSALSWMDPVPIMAGENFYRVSADNTPPERGKLLSVTQVGSLSVSNIQAMLDAAGVPLAAAMPVLAYKIDYETVNPFNLRTVASGLLALPLAPTNTLPLVSYQHGTIVTKTGVPSGLQGLESLIGIFLATGGYAAALPDYLGLGDSPGLHPYIHAKSEATSVIDMLRAARAFCASNSIALNGQLFLVGYSEGGHATMAAHREIEAHYTNEFTVTACAPMAGPYDMSGTMVQDFLSNRAMPNPYYLFYLLAAYQSIYHVAASFSDILASPFDRTLPPLLDGQHSGDDINQAIGSSIPATVVKPEFLSAFRNDPNHPLRLALADNDVYDWTPRAPMRMYHCAADQDVLFANSQVAYDTFLKRGDTQVELLGGNVELDHEDCAPPSLLAAKLWFDTLVKP
jgi:hypothetical protein